ncbi:MAG: DUF4350 domain-containing protein [Aureliella sp.]
MNPTEFARRSKLGSHAPGPYLRWILTLAVLLGSSASTANSNAQDSPPPGWQFQHDLFQMLLEERGLEIYDDWGSAFVEPKQAVMVITGSMQSVSAEQRNRLIQFVLAGGNLLVATNSGIFMRGIGQTDGRIISARYETDKYENYEDCLQRKPPTSALELAGIDRIVANRCTWFRPNRSSLNWESWLLAPEFCDPTSARARPILARGYSRRQPRPSSKRGQVIVAADSSLFSNGMLWHGDNAELAVRVSDILSGGERSRLVFVEDGIPLESIRSRISPPPIDPSNPAPPIEPEASWERALRLANIVASEVQDSNIVNETLMRRPRNPNTWRYYEALLVGLVIIVTALLIWIIARSGVIKNSFLEPRKMLAAFQLSTYANPRTMDYRTAAGLLAREFCFEITGSQSSQDWQNFWIKAQDGEIGLKDPVDIKRLGTIIDVAGRGFVERVGKLDFEHFGWTIGDVRSKILSHTKNSGSSSS